MPSIHRMPWGKYKGVPLDDIDADYLLWVVNVAEATRPGLRVDIEAELARRQRAHEPPPPPSSWRKPCPDATLAKDLIATGLRNLAKRHHPDIGGDTALMQTLNATADWLKMQVPQ